MFIDFTHNTVIKNTITEGFKSKFESGVVPALCDIYGNRLLGVQLYEDYLSVDLSCDGYWYYPLTAILAEGHETVWIRWSMISASDFEGGVPYAFVGYSLDFEICDNVPEEIKGKTCGAGYAPEGALSLQVHAAHPDKTFISGKYSQTFIDEMARQLTRAISREMEVDGLASSSVELSLVFAPDTYMEHTSENVTYRRLLLTAKGCTPRDFWIKWTRLNSSSAYSVRDNAERGSVVFEIGEDVPQKIREKEYRFLVHGNSDKYRTAMSRKTVVEWREIIKRALKRGELTKALAESLPEALAEEKLEPVTTPSAEQTDSEVSDKLLEILAKCGVSASAEPEIEVAPAPASNPAFDEAMRIARAAAGIFDEAEGVEEIETMDLPGLELTINSPIPEAMPEVEELDDSEEIEQPYSEPLLEDEAEAEEAPVAEEVDEAEAEEELSAAAEDKSEEQQEAVPAFDSKPIEPAYNPNSELIARLLKETEELRRREELLRAENQRLAEAAVAAEEQRRIAEAAKEAESELRRRLEQEERSREREKLLFAEAARQAQLENERRRREEEEREEERRAAEAMRIEAERNALEEESLLREKRRIEEEAMSRLSQKEEMENRAKEARERLEAEARAKAREIFGSVAEPATAEPEVSDAPEEAPAPAPEYTYTSKTVRLMFRRQIDPNVTARIHELISGALAYYHKEQVYIKVKAMISDSYTVVLNFVKIPEEELELLVNIIKLLGNSDLGITKAILE